MLVLASMGSIGDAYDNAMAESFFSTLQRELLDEHRWESRRLSRGTAFGGDDSATEPSARG